MFQVSYIQTVHETMRQKYIFHHDHYYHTLKSQIGGQIPVFHGVRQRGGGLGSVLGGISKYALPLIMKYVLPHAKEAGLRTISDVVKGSSVKSALKKNGVGFLKNVGGELIRSTLNSSKTQRGKGVRVTSKKRKTKEKAKKGKKRKANPKKVPAKRSRKDIFS